MAFLWALNQKNAKEGQRDEADHAKQHQCRLSSETISVASVEVDSPKRAQFISPAMTQLLFVNAAQSNYKIYQLQC